MKSAVYLTLGCGLSLALAALLFPGVAPEFVMGMAGPFVVTTSSLVMIERVYQRDPRRLTPLMIKAFGAKMVLFGAYVALMLSLTGLSPIPFVSSFCASFVILHLTEAVLLRSLFAKAFS